MDSVAECLTYWRSRPLGRLWPSLLLCPRAGLFLSLGSCPKPKFRVQVVKSMKLGVYRAEWGELTPLNGATQLSSFAATWGCRQNFPKSSKFKGKRSFKMILFFFFSPSMLATNFKSKKLSTNTSISVGWTELWPGHDDSCPGSSTQRTGSKH